jgi:hypothetical protein
MKAAIIKGAAQSSNETKTYFGCCRNANIAASSKIVAIVAIVAAACSC